MKRDPLRWRGNPGSTLLATGVTAFFTIRFRGHQQYVLTGIDRHDRLPLLSLPPDGHAFIDVEDAKAMAEDLDQRAPVGEASGT